MSPLRARMIEDMILAGLAASTQAVYVEAVRRLAAHYRRSPDELSEAEVRSYLLGLRAKGIARGTFKSNHYGIQFLYRHTLDRDWPLFSKKRFASRSRSACPMRSPTPRSAACCAA
jgi:integrase-like protein